MIQETLVNFFLFLNPSSEDGGRDVFHHSTLPLHPWNQLYVLYFVWYNYFFFLFSFFFKQVINKSGLRFTFSRFWQRM